MKKDYVDHTMNKNHPEQEINIRKTTKDKRLTLETRKDKRRSLTPLRSNCYLELPPKERMALRYKGESEKVDYMYIGWVDQT